MAEGNIAHPESGSNTYGNYVCLENGTLIEWGRISITVPAQSFAEATITFPKSFTGYPSMSLESELYSRPEYFSCMIRSASPTAPVIRVATSLTDDQSMYINWIAIGKA